MRRLARLACVVWVSAVSVALADDWPQFRGPDADGISPETGINKDWAAKAPKELWKVELGDQGYGGPAVANGKVFIVDHSGNQDIVRALDFENGEEVWRYAYDESGGPNYGFNRATPTIVDGLVYTVSMKGVVNCLSEEDGKLVWTKSLVADFGGRSPTWGFASSAVVDDGKLILCPGGDGSSVVAVDCKTGELIWKSGTDKPGYSTPVIATINDARQYLIFSASSINGYAAEDGKKLWTFPWKTTYDVNAAAPLVMENSVFISSDYGTGCAMLDIQARGPKVRWRHKLIQEHFSSGVLIDGMIYSTTDPGDLVCLDAATGKQQWRQQGGFEKGGLIAADGVLLALTGGDGQLIMVGVNSAAYNELGRMKPLGEQSWTAPVLADGRLLVRNKQAMVCLDLK